MWAVPARAALLCVGLLGACSSPDPSPEAEAPRVAFDAQGHRGARGLLPENTLPAFERALELGVSTLELDVGVTRDRAVVVAHDAYVPPAICLRGDGRPIDGERGPLLRDLSLAEVRAYDCGSLNPDLQRFPEPPREQRPGTPMPTLGEVFDLVALRGDTHVRFSVEIKLQPGDLETLPAPEFVVVVLDEVKQHDLLARVSLQSFDWRALVLAKQKAPGIQTVALLAPDTLDPEWLNGLEPQAFDGVLGLLRAAQPYVDVFSPYWRMLLPPANERPLPLPEIQAAGFPVVPWTVNDEDDMRALMRLGVDGIISDYPDRLLAVLRSESIDVR